MEANATCGANCTQLGLWGGIAGMTANSANKASSAFLSRKNAKADYDAFIEKFKPKKTTDDCYTPKNVYDAVAGWVESEYHVSRECFVRPFCPGGDFELYHYPEGCIVVDNPPFSIFSRIVKFYIARGIRFFLFAPALTLVGSTNGCCAVCVGADVTYENGALVKTSFATNLDSARIRSAPTLYRAVQEANDANLKAMHAQLPKYEYPMHIVTSAMVHRYSHYGVDFRVDAGDSVFIRSLDAQRECDKSIFGGGLLLSERAAAERAAAKVWKLSEREQGVVRTLGEKHEKPAEP